MDSDTLKSRQFIFCIKQLEAGQYELSFGISPNDNIAGYLKTDYDKVEFLKVYVVK